ncbi:conserved membrane protein, unknown function, partial [Hepatocystis sp. ex Piliocolobus tephrosceles]
LFKIISYKIKEKFYFFNSNNNKMVRLGYKRECCCCLSLAEANILIACLYILITLPHLINLKNSQDKETIMMPILEFIYAILLLLGVIFKNYLAFIIVIVDQLLWMIMSIFISIMYVLESISNDRSNKIDKSILSPAVIITIATIFSILIISISVYFINIYISMVRILKAGGSGWEHKNFEQIENEKHETQMQNGIHIQKHNEYIA